MTICLGALCEDGEKIVVAADRMITFGDSEFERDVRKIIPITQTCMLLSSGSTLPKIDLIRDVKRDLREHRSPNVEQVVASLKEKFVGKRCQRAEELHLHPLGLDFGQFIRNQGNLSDGLASRLTQKIEDESLGLTLLVAGVDSDGGHLYLVKDPGISNCYDVVGFLTIGSGEHHADLSFIRASYSPTILLKRAVFLAYQAKRDAEMAPGVGSRYTDIGIIDEDGVSFLSDEILLELGEVYKVLMESNIKSNREIDAKIESLDLSPSGMTKAVTRKQENHEGGNMTNSIMVIFPYLYNGTWVFDDKSKQFDKEAFVAGIPPMMESLTSQIPNAHNGFRMLFSAAPFPGCHKALEWVRSEAAGGNWYKETETDLEGWLCPSIFKYFDEAPKNIYVQAEPLNHSLDR